MGIPSYGVDYEGQYDFLQIGTITSAQAALAVTARDNASVDDLAAIKKVIWRPDAGTAAAILRFRVDGAEDDAPVIQVYAAKGADYYTRIATLTLAQGTQDWSGGHFVDEITLSNEKWSHGIRADSVTDEIGRVVFNTGGFDRFLFIASTLAVTTIRIDIARLDKQIDHGIEIHSAILVLADNMTVSDVVSAISDMHSGLDSILGSVLDDTSETVSVLSIIHDDTVDIASATDATRKGIDSGLSAQNSSIITELEGIETTLNAISGHTDSAVDYISSLVTGVETVETTLNTISGAIDSTLDYTSSLVTGVETANTNLTGIKSAISDGLSAQNSSIITELEGIETTLNTISGAIDSTLDYTSSLVTGVETANTNLTGIKSAISDGLSAQFSSIITELEGIETTLNAISGHTDSAVDYISSLVTGVETVETTLNTISGAIDSTLDYTSSLVTGVETANTNLTGIKSAISDGLSAQFSSIITELEGIETTLNTISGAIDSTLDYTSSLVTGVETVNTNLGTLENDVTSVHSVIKRANISTTSSALWLSDIASAADAARSILSDTVTDGFTAANASLDSIESALTQIATDGVDLSDIVSANLATKGAVDLVTTEISDAISNLKSATIAHGDIGLISGPETVVVDSNTETLSELGIALEAGIRRVTLIPAGSGIYWADGAATQGVNPFPNAVTQIDCNRSQILAREFVTSANVSVAMQVIQEG